MASRLPWFRFYFEALRDRKLDRACIMSKQPKYAILGMWVSMLCMAADSPQRGKLLLTGDEPVTEEEIAYEIGMDPLTIASILKVFQKLNMITISSCIEITNWHERKKMSDSGAERQRRFRARKKAETTANSESNETVTLPERDSNDLDKIREDKIREDKIRATPKPSVAPTTDDAAYKIIMDVWSAWRTASGASWPNDPAKQREYIASINDLLLRIDWNAEHAIELMKTERQKQIASGKTPYRPAAVVGYILADLDGYDDTTVSPTPSQRTEYRPKTAAEQLAEALGK